MTPNRVGWGHMIYPSAVYVVTFASLFVQCIVLNKNAPGIGKLFALVCTRFSADTFLLSVDTGTDTVVRKIYHNLGVRGRCILQKATQTNMAIANKTYRAHLPGHGSKRPRIHRCTMPSCSGRDLFSPVTTTTQTDRRQQKPKK
jgi:hypothetical protein